MISVAIVEDSAGVRRNLELLVSESPGIRCVCACGSGEEALRLIPRKVPDVVLMDIHLPDLSGIECTSRLKQLMPATQVIIISVYADMDKIFSALRAGASGYLLKRSPPEEIIEAITEVSRGGAPMTSEIARKVVEAFREPVRAVPEGSDLTRREHEILELLCQGFADKEIAQALSISFDTVRWHLKQVFEKLHVRSRTEAAVTYLGLRDSSSGPSKPPPA